MNLHRPQRVGPEMSTDSCQCPCSPMSPLLFVDDSDNDDDDDDFYERKQYDDDLDESSDDYMQLTCDN